jgi:peptidoglycan hydrolase-like protein with peptidoglycan-binding domain
MLDKQAIRKRALEHHSPTGRVMVTLEKILNTNYPTGTNLVLKFMELMVGMPYGHVDMCMDKVTDCAEFIRITIYIFFGKDIGNSSHTQYINPKGKIVCTKWNELYKCRPLTLAFYDVDDNSTTVRKDGEDHVATVYDSKHLIQSGASRDTNGRRLYSKVAITDIMWHPVDKDGHFLLAKDFLSDEEYNSMIIGGETTDIMINKNSDTKLIKAFQTDLFDVGYQCKMNASFLGQWGTNTEDAIKAFQKDNKLPETGVVDAWTFQKMVEAKAAKAAEPIKTLQIQVTTLKEQVTKYTNEKAATIKWFNQSPLK